jgi:aconitate decarboxylase
MDNAESFAGRDPIVDLARNAVNTRFEDLPAESVSFQKQRMVDNIGTCLAGSSETTVGWVRELVAEWEGKSQCTVLVHGLKAPCQDAAFINSVMARVLDFCDGANPGYHPSSTDIPTALAVGEMLGSNGKEIITALAVGADVAHRIISAGTYEKSTSHAFHGFDGNVVGVFAGAAISGKLLGLDVDQMTHALGIALNQAAGTLQSNIDAALVVPVIQGFITRGGILSALLARKGITGVKNVLLGPYGFYHLYTRGKCRPQMLTEDLGKRFCGPEYTFFKKYPSCGLSLCITDAALDLASKSEFGPDDVESISVKLSDVGYHVIGKAFTLGEHPDVDAKFSAQYCIANAVARRDSRLEHFTDRYIRDPAVLSLVNRIEVSLDKEMILDENVVEVRLKSGRQLTSHKQWGKGWPQNPLTKDEFEEKFRRCMAYAPVKTLSVNVNMIVETINSLEDVQDLRDLIGLLVKG